jgi:hypothetical protein
MNSKLVKPVTAFALAAMVFAAGWWGRGAIADDLHRGLQWRFADAAGRGDTRELERLLQKGASVDAEPSYGDGAVTSFPALLRAAYAAEPEAVKWLLAHGADVNRPFSDAHPLIMAEQRLAKAAETVRILQAHGAKHF